MERTDAELMLQIQRGNKRAFENLVRRFEVPLMRYLVRMTGNTAEAEDLFQDCWIKVYNGRNGFRKGEDPRGWIFAIARNACLNHLKRRERIKTFDPERLDLHTGSRCSPLQQIDEVEATRRLDVALQALAPALREALILRFYEEMSYSEIAETMGVPIGTVGYWISEALKTLSKELKET